jgi:hypothetical protein
LVGGVETGDFWVGFDSGFVLGGTNISDSHLN